MAGWFASIFIWTNKQSKSKDALNDSQATDKKSHSK